MAEVSPSDKQRAEALLARLIRQPGATFQFLWSRSQL
jgi:hypothetical protein